MITYTLPMNVGSGDAVALGLKIQEIGGKEKDVNALTPRLFEVLTQFFPLRHICISHTLNQPDEEWYYLYPPLPGIGADKEARSCSRSPETFGQNNGKNFLAPEACTMPGNGLLFLRTGLCQGSHGLCRNADARHYFRIIQWLRSIQPYFHHVEDCGHGEYSDFLQLFSSSSHVAESAVMPAVSCSCFS
ncbi:hypothetical protein [Mailhella massiliensis]|uniref:Uncharacterized protein n=1 Tax=Mailhella massiliensis TaxID=1903261 RepID=A0A921DQU6_9BACT|nr:hypothetical protein [Mailhella massiliensis]HJD96321.1 hypothetical protein [Mailhella massiliensis]